MSLGLRLGDGTFGAVYSATLGASRAVVVKKPKNVPGAMEGAVRRAVAERPLEGDAPNLQRGPAGGRWSRWNAVLRPRAVKELARANRARRLYHWDLNTTRSHLLDFGRFVVFAKPAEQALIVCTLSVT